MATTFRTAGVAHLSGAPGGGSLEYSEAVRATCRRRRWYRSPLPRSNCNLHSHSLQRCSDRGTYETGQAYLAAVAV